MSTSSRLPSLPDIATFAEQGIGGATLYESFAFFAPANTPPSLIAEAGRALRTSAADRNIVDALAKLEIQAEYRDAAALADQLRQDTEWWRPVVKASGFQIED